MKFYFSSNQIPTLNQFNINERQHIIHLAKQQFTTVEKLIINLIKLCLIAPIFLLIAQQTGLMILAPIPLFFIGYFLLVQPISLQFVERHLTKSIDKFKSLNKPE